MPWEAPEDWERVKVELLENLGLDTQELKAENGIIIQKPMKNCTPP